MKERINDINHTGGRERDKELEGGIEIERERERGMGGGGEIERGGKEGGRNIKEFSFLYIVYYLSYKERNKK